MCRARNDPSRHHRDLPECGVATAESQDTVSVRLLAFNDLHGSLRPPEGIRSEIRQADGSLTPAGGAAYLAAYVTQLRSQATQLAAVFGR